MGRVPPRGWAPPGPHLTRGVGWTCLQVVFAVEASKRGMKVGLAHVKNGTGLFNVFHAALVAAGVINWGEYHVKNGTALFDQKHDDKRQEWRSNGGKKGKGVKMGKGKKGTKVS